MSRRSVADRSNILLAPLAMLLLSTGACVSPGQSRSVSEQVAEIRRQAEQVGNDQQRNRNAIDEIGPLLGGSAAGEPRLDEPRSPVAEPLNRPVWVDAADRLPPDDPVAAPAETPESMVVVRAETPERAVASRAEGDETPPGSAEAAGPPLPESGGDLFREGYALYYRRDYREAEARMRSYLRDYPGSAMADDAQYWIGECRYARGLYRDAITEYHRLIESYPEARQVAQAYYKIALSHESLGEEDAMRLNLATLVDRYPESDVAVLARSRLSER